MKRAMMAVVVMTACGACDMGAQGGPLAAAPAHTQRADAWRVNLKAEREALTEADHAFSQATETQGLIDGFTRYFADDAAFLPPRAGVLRGRAAMREYLRGSPLFGTLKWETVRADVSADGTAGYTLGFGELRTRDGATLWHARMITFWRKQPGGEWKVEANVPIGISVPARPVPAGFGTPRDDGVAGADRRLGQAAAAEAVQQADRDFAALSARTDPGRAFMAFAAPTAVTMGSPNYGPEEIGKAFEGGSATIEWGPVAGGAAASGDLGYSIGIATTRAQTPEGPRVSYSKYLTVWRRQADGRWLYVADGGTSRPAPAN